MRPAISDESDDYGVVIRLEMRQTIREASDD